MNEIKILNNQQVYYYMENGVQPIRLECGRDNKVVFIFDKKQTQELYIEWVKKAQWKKSVN